MSIRTFSIEKRIDWLRKAGYAPDVCEQLSRIYRQEGLDHDARRIAIAGQRDRRKRGGMPWPSRLWNYFLDKTVRYGHELHRPLLVVLLGGLVGTVLLYLAQAYGLMEAVSPPQGENDQCKEMHLNLSVLFSAHLCVRTVLARDKSSSGGLLAVQRNYWVRPDVASAGVARDPFWVDVHCRRRRRNRAPGQPAGLNRS